MEIDPATLDRRSAYQLMISCIIPRPIAWVTSISKEGVVNLAPFSYFNGVSSHPPIVSIAVGSRRDGRKDTWINIEETGEFVVNVVTEELADVMVQTSKEYPHNVSELEELKLAPVASRKVGVPGVARSPVRMECTRHRVIEIEGGTALILGRVVHVHIDDAVVRDGVVNAEALTMVGRLGGDGYTLVNNFFVKRRPG